MGTTTTIFRCSKATAARCGWPKATSSTSTTTKTTWASATRCCGWSTAVAERSKAAAIAKTKTGWKSQREGLEREQIQTGCYWKGRDPGGDRICSNGKKRRCSDGHSMLQ